MRPNSNSWFTFQILNRATCVNRSQIVTGSTRRLILPVTVTKESDLFAISSWRGHQSSDRIEHDFELLIVLAFELVQPASKFCVGHEQLPELHEGAHDFDVNGYRALTA